MQGAKHRSAEPDRRDDADLAEVDGLGVAAVVLYGRDASDPGPRAAEEPRTFAAKSSWLWRWAGWRRPG